MVATPLPSNTSLSVGLSVIVDRPSTLPPIFMFEVWSLVFDDDNGTKATPSDYYFMILRLRMVFKGEGEVESSGFFIELGFENWS